MKERKMILSFRGKWLISLLMLLLVSVGMQAQYDISVAGTTVTSANASNVLGDGTVSFEPTTNTLTLNGAVITLSTATPYAVSSGIKDLKIKLIGENVINASTSPVFDCEPDAEEGDITFVTETGASGAVYGSLQINGIYQYDNLTERYHIKNTWLESDEDGWHKKEMDNEASEEKYVKLFYAKYYDLWIKGERISLENVNSIGEGISFDEEANTLTLDNATIDMSNITGSCAIESGIANLKLKLMGNNSIVIGDGSNSPFAFGYRGAETTAQLTFETEKNEFDIFGTLSVSGVQSVDNLANGYQITNTLQSNTAENKQTGWEYETQSGMYKSVTLRYVEYYGLWIGGAQISSNNLSPVSGGTAYIPESHTLHLQGYGYEDAIRSDMAELIVEVAGNNSLSRIYYVGTGGGRLMLRAAENSSNANTINLNSADGVIVGFSEVVINEPLRVVTPAETPAEWTASVGSAVISDDMFISVAGVKVTAANKNNITGEGIYGDGTASFDSETNTLTLNNIKLNPDYSQNDGDLRVSIVTSLAQLNINLIGESQTYAIKATDENCALTFKSAKENKATARLNFWYNADPQFVGFGEGKVTYENGLCLRDDETNSSFPKVVALHVPKVVTEEKERGLYYPDHEFTFSLDEAVDGFDIYYANMLGGDPVKTTNGKFTLGTGRYLLRVYPIYPGMDTEPSRNWQFSSEISAKVIAKPTFTVADGTYNESKNVKLENIPEQGADAESYPQVWYYLNDVKNDSVRYDATKGIDVTESCKVSVYVLDEDSSRVIKSEPVEAQYVIRQDAGLAFTAEEAEYTIGGENNQELPTLANANNVAVTYSSSNETVATVDTDGKVTIVGMGETTIKAASQQTDELLAGEATYVLKVYKDINYSSITVTLSELTYNGQPQTPTVTVKDGETVLTAAVNYLVIAPEAGNTNAVDATAANAPIVTINANTDAEVNYYVGERQVKFGIAPKALTEEMVTLSKTSFEYSGENQKPTVTVADGELMTTNDYTITNEGGVEVGEYTVKVVAKNNYTGTVEKSFEIVTRTLEIGKDVNFVEGQKWASYYTTTEDLVLPEGLMAYIVTATSADAVAVKAINYVPKNVAVLIEKASTTTTDNTSAEGNLLQGTASATNVSDIAGNAYVLYNNGFTRATSGQIPAHRAYLVLAEPAGARLAIFDEETTGMETVSRDKVATYGNIYDLQGRKISNGQWSMVNGQLKKGLYIVNGKKIVVK